VPKNQEIKSVMGPEGRKELPRKQEAGCKEELQEETGVGRGEPGGKKEHMRP